MYESEKLCLKWNDFQVNVNSAFGMLRNDLDLCNVTLVSEDGKHLEAHKVILSSSSPFFLKLLKRNKHPHPLIYMRGVKADELSSLIDFLYYGEANACRLRWLFRGFLATGYIARYIWLYSQELYSQLYLAI